MDILRHRETVEHEIVERFFEWRDRPGAGFGFACDAAGAVDVGTLNAAAADSYARCASGELNVIDRGVKIARWTSIRPAVGRCDCGREVELGAFTNACECGADYNGAGQRLAPREQWGEETGEHWTECIGPFGDGAFDGE